MIRNSRRKREAERRKKIWNRGFTDRLYFLNLILAWIFIVVCIIVTLLSGVLGISDLSLVSVGIPAVFAEVAVHSGFIIWKAKVENCRKYGRVRYEDIENEGLTYEEEQ